MTVTIKGNYPITSLDIKRFYLPGMKISAECPECGETVTKNMKYEYFGYPAVNMFQDYIFYHECSKSESGDYEWKEEFMLKLGVEIRK